jgi:hypothetical protein
MTVLVVPCSAARAASISDTMRWSPWAEPGSADVTPRPKMIEHGESGGVNCKIPNCS